VRVIGTEEVPVEGGEEDETRTVDVTSPVLEFIKMADGVYRLPVASDLEGLDAAAIEDLLTIDLTTNDKGELHIYGLDSDKYILQETFALDGYNYLYNTVAVFIRRGVPLMGKYTIDIAHTDNRDRENVYFHTTDLELIPVAGQLHRLQIANYASGMFPGTGGMGTTIFYTIAITMLVTLAVVYVNSRRRSTPSILDA
jgi:hypothetical protein